ncbi:MAG: 3'-5' exonuclease [Verrucomicrobiota bacterium]
MTSILAKIFARFKGKAKDTRAGSSSVEVEEEADGRSITKEAINKLPLKRYEGPIVWVDSDKAAARAILELEAEKVLGFDTETKPSFRKKQSFLPSLLQFATSDKVFLFRLPSLKNFAGFAEILSDKKVLKTGVALDQDIKKLNEIFEFEPNGFVDLGKLAQTHQFRQTGLRNLCAILLGFRLSKGSQVTDWSKEKLSSAQINYAATDAWASRELYIFMKRSSEWEV